MTKRRRRRLRSNPAPAPANPLHEIMQELLGGLKMTAIRGIQTMFQGPAVGFGFDGQQAPLAQPAPPEPEIKEAQVISIRTSK